MMRTEREPTANLPPVHETPIPLAPRATWTVWFWWGLGLTCLALLMPSIRRRGELPVYTKAADRYLSGQQFYRPDDPPSFTYPPFCILPFTALPGLPDYPRAAFWWLVNLILATLSVREIVRMARPTVVAQRSTHSTSPAPPDWLAPLMIALLSVRYFVSPLEYQSNDMVVLYLFLLALRGLARRESGVISGIWAGLAAAYKATPLLLLPLLIWQKRFWAALAMVMSLTLATLLPDLLVRNPDATLWVQTWHQRFVSKVSVGKAADADGAWVRWNPLNQSLPGTIYRLFTPVKNEGDYINVAIASWNEAQQSRLTITLQILVLAGLAWAGLPWPAGPASPSPSSLDLSPGSRDALRMALGQGGTVLCGMLLLSPMSSTQHFVVLVVPITYLVLSLLYGANRLGIGLALIVVLFLGTLSAQDIVGSAWADRVQAAGGSTVATLVIFCASVIGLHHDRRQWIAAIPSRG